MPKLAKNKQKKYRRVLLQIVQQLGGKLDRMGEAVLRSENETSLDESEESGSEGYAREFQLGLIENEDEILQLVYEALSRIEEGTYGTCDGCECVIPERRLDAVPYARYCVECQAKAEAGLLGDDE